MVFIQGTHEEHDTAGAYLAKSQSQVLMDVLLNTPTAIILEFFWFLNRCFISC